MSKKIRLILVSTLLLVFALAAIFVTIFSSDFFYLVIGLIIDTIVILLFYPKLFSSMQISIPTKQSGTKKVSFFKRKKFSKVKLSIVKFKFNFRSKLLLAHIIFLVTLSSVFGYLLVFRLKVPTTQSNFIFAYINSLYEKNIELGWLLFMIPFLLLFSLSFLLIKSGGRFKKIFLAITTTFANITLAAALALLLGLIFSLFNISNFKKQIVSNPQAVGIYTEQDRILEELRKFDDPPEIIGKDDDVGSIVISLQLKNKGEFYKEKIVPLAVKLSPFKLELSSYPILLVKNTLIIAEINKEEIEAISPIVSKLLVKKALAPRYIKEEPNVTIMGRQEYLRYRDDQINKAIAEIDDIIVEIEQDINTLYANISEDKRMITVNENGLNESISSGNESYQYCISAGYYSYYFGTFYRYYSDSYCNNLRAEWDSLIAQYQRNIQDWKEQLAYDQRQLSEFQEFKTLVEYYRELKASQKDKAPNELGIFEPEDSIKAVLENTSSSSLADFFATLVHEYLHYTSYVSEERILDGFFEEGLTEYFARKTIQENLDVSTRLGYPLISNIISEMTKKVSEDRLEEIYFTKNHNALVDLLDQTYGDNFYEDSQLYFTIIYYIPSVDALKIANNIMFRIGGDELSEEDLYSTYSELK